MELSQSVREGRVRCSGFGLSELASEPGETLEQARARAVLEEACARVVSSSYIGCQRVGELDGGGVAYYQTRFLVTATEKIKVPEGKTETVRFAETASQTVIGRVQSYQMNRDVGDSHVRDSAKTP